MQKILCLTLLVLLTVSLSLANAEVQVALEKGLNWVLSSQAEDGSWGGERENTGGVLSLLVDTFGAETLGESAVKAAEYILSNVKLPIGPFFDIEENSSGIYRTTYLVDAGYINIALEVLGKRTVKQRVLMNRQIAEIEEALLKLDDATFGNIVHLLVIGRFGLTYRILERCLNILSRAVEEDKPTYGIVYALAKYAYPLPEEVIELGRKRLEEMLNEWGDHLTDLRLIALTGTTTVLCLFNSKDTLIDSVVDLLLKLQNEDGSWGNEYKLETTVFVVEFLKHYLE